MKTNCYLPAARRSWFRWAALFSLFTFSLLADSDLSVNVIGTPTALFNTNILTYTITVSNAGPDGVTAAVLTDTLPNGYVITNITTSQGSIVDTNAIPLVFTLGSIDASNFATVIIQGIPTNPNTGTVTNIAVVTFEFDDLFPIDNTNTNVVKVLDPNWADMAVNMISSTNSAPVGTTFTYTIFVTNRGPSIVTNAALVDTPSANLRIGTITTTRGTLTTNNGSYFFNLGLMASNANATITIQVTPIAIGPTLNTATVSSEHPDVISFNDTLAVAATATVPLVANLGLNATASTNVILSGNPLIYTFLITNYGPADVTGAVITNILPAHTILNSVTQSQGTYTVAGSTLALNLGALAVNATATVVLQVTPTAGGTFTDTVSLSSEKQDTTTGNNSAALTIVVNPVNLAIGVVGSPAAVIVGAPVNFDLAVTNFGPGTATGVLLTDTLPAGWTVLGFSQSQGSFSNNTGTVVFNFGVMPSNAVAHASIQAAATSAAGDAVNFASVAANETETDPSDNLVSVHTTINPQPPMISNVVASAVTKSAFISWNTYSNATAQVAYGLTPAYGSVSYLNPNLTTKHIVWLTGLQTNTTYYYQIITVSGGVTYTTNGTVTTAGTSYVIDNPAANIFGAWVLSTAASNKFGTTYLVTSTDTNNFSAGATYRPNLAVAGLYDVYVWYTEGTNLSTNVFYQMGARTNTANFRINQNTGAGQWRLLQSSVPFAAGTNGFVTVYNFTGESNKFVVADAAQWIYNPAQEKPADNIIPDWWANAYFGGPVSGTADADGDGYSNYQEFILGTNPNDASDKLNMRVAHPQTNIVSVTFGPYQAARAYQLQRSITLVNPSWLTLTNQPVINGNGEGVFTVTTTVTNGFYRLMTTQP